MERLLSGIVSAFLIPVGNAIWSLDSTVAGVVLAVLRVGILVCTAYMLAPLGTKGLAWAYCATSVILFSVVFRTCTG